MGLRKFSTLVLLYLLTAKIMQKPSAVSYYQRANTGLCREYEAELCMHDGRTSPVHFWEFERRGSQGTLLIPCMPCYPISTQRESIILLKLTYCCLKPWQIWGSVIYRQFRIMRNDLSGPTVPCAEEHMCIKASYSIIFCKVHVHSTFWGLGRLHIHSSSQPCNLQT